MTKEAFLQFSARDLIKEIARTAHDGAPSLLTGAILKVAESLDSEVSELMAQVVRLKEQRACWHLGQSSEDARRRLQNPKLRTTYAVDRARALLAKRLELSEEVATLGEKLFAPLAKLEMLDAELHALREILISVQQTRTFHRRTGVYAGSADFLTRLHDNHRVDWRDLVCLTEDDEREIADVIRRRVSAARDEDAART